MRDRVRIRCTAPGEWTVTLPAFGFGSAVTIPAPHPTHRAAVGWTDRHIRRPGSTDLTTETAWQPSDGVSPVPCWTPLTTEEAQA